MSTFYVWDGVWVKTTSLEEALETRRGVLERFPLPRNARPQLRLYGRNPLVPDVVFPPPAASATPRVVTPEQTEKAPHTRMRSQRRRKVRRVIFGDGAPAASPLATVPRLIGDMVSEDHGLKRSDSANELIYTRPAWLD